MSATQTATHVAPSVLKRQRFSARFWGVGALTILTAVLVNTLIVLAAHALFTVAPAFGPLQLASDIPATMVAVAGALVVFALISRRSQQPARIFRRVALAVLLLTIVPISLLPVVKLFPGTTLPVLGTLLLMHAATALLCVSLAPLMLSSRSRM